MKVLNVSSDARVAEYLLTNKPYNSYQTKKVATKAAANNHFVDTYSRRYLTQSKRTSAVLLRPPAPSRLVSAHEYLKCDERMIKTARQNSNREVLVDG